jgi:hemerythrin-like domain-containing protein
MIVTTANSATPPRAAESAINRIKAEHRALACMLAAMQALVVRYREPDSKPDYGLFDSMLRYIENVPDRLHHPKEDQLLFVAVLQHAPNGKALVRELEQDHARGTPMLLELRRAFYAFRSGETNALNQLATAIDEFAEFYWWHMRKEELQLLPLALAHLSDSDWRRVDSAFGDNTDPLFGSELTDEYRRLYQNIAELAPRHLRSLLERAALTAP